MKNEIKLHVFDIDGTVLDSMPMWDRISFEYLDEMGIEAPDELAETVDPMPVPVLCEYLANQFRIPGGTEAVLENMTERLCHQYANVLQPFSDAVQELEELASKCKRMVAFSNTPHFILDSAIRRCNLNRFFTHVYSVEDLNVRKDSPDAFIKLARVEGVLPSEMLVHDDSAFALNAARDAGCRVKTYDRYRGTCRSSIIPGDAEMSNVNLFV